MLAVVLALKLPTILILVWAFSRPEDSFRPGRRYWAVLAITVVHVLLALLSLTGEKSSLSEMFVAYPHSTAGDRLLPVRNFDRTRSILLGQLRWRLAPLHAPFLGSQFRLAGHERLAPAPPSNLHGRRQRWQSLDRDTVGWIRSPQR